MLLWIKLGTILITHNIYIYIYNLDQEFKAKVTVLYTNLSNCVWILFFNSLHEIVEYLHVSQKVGFQIILYIFRKVIEYSSRLFYS